MSENNSAKPKGFKFDYICDGCSLAITVNNVDMSLLNHVGDGDGTVYVHGLDEGDPLDLPDNSQADLVLTVGDFNEHAPISLGLKYSDISSDVPDVFIVAKQFHISEVRNSRDFVIRVSDPMCVTGETKP